MIQFTNNDSLLLKEYYLQFLQNIKTFLLENNIFLLNDQFSCLRYLLENAYFTDENQMIFSDSYNYLGFHSNLDNGLQVMCGICCCRHVNSLLEGVLAQLQYPINPTFFYIDRDIWYRRKFGTNANHLAISLQKGEQEWILDLYNNFIFSFDSKGKIQLLNTSLNMDLKNKCQQYQDQENIRPISKILKKYYHLSSLGITHIYEEEKYGID